MHSGKTTTLAHGWGAGIALAGMLALGGERLRAAELPLDFAADIQPILQQNCSGCHAGPSPASGLSVNSLVGLQKGGAQAGPAVIAGNSNASPIIRYLKGAASPRMPMGKKALEPETIALMARWIDGGMKSAAGAAGASPAKKKPGWPWTPLAETAVPGVKRKDWVRTPVDAFVLAKLEQKNVTPAPAASSRSLYRRLYYGLVGVPPTPEEMESFLKNPTPDAYRAEVEKLLGDSRYGEKWGRHWLDLVRYSDTRGGAIDYPRPHMWRYRDYVIRAFNQDRPYDRFIKEQIAGDGFPAYGAEGKLGLAFLGQWVDVEQVDHEQLRRDYLVDVVDTTASVFLGMTLGCARCHDHKYDPLPQKDYYRLEAFFAPTTVDVAELPFHQYEMPQADAERWNKSMKEWKSTLDERDKGITAFRESLKKRQEPYQILFGAQDLKDWAEPGQRKYSVPGDMLTTQQEKDRLKLIGRQTARFANPNTADYYLPKAHLVADSPLFHNVSTKLLAGGNFKLPGEEVKPGFLSAATGNSDPVDLDGIYGNRRQLLAKWIASRDNPLTARVMVNRIWQYHFGKGLVATPSDFGRNGAGTVQRELLDWLAWRFIESGWSVKEIHRLILNSSVYQESMKHPDAAHAASVDPDNQYLWMRDPIRIEVEAIRDSMLAVSGQLNPAAGGPPFFPEANDEQMARAATWWEPSERRERNRRSIYMLQIRSFQLPMMRVFDGANMDQSCVVRGLTSVTPQVFALFNSQFSHEQSAEMARRIVTEAGADRAKQVDRAFQLAFQRPPSASDREMGLAFLARQDSSLTDLCLVLLNMNEFIFLD